jgi:hypothetical protein
MTHLTWEELVDYWAGDGGDPDAADAHLFACDACSERSARVATVTETLRSEIPFIVTMPWVDTLRRRGMRFTDNPMQPGERREVPFTGDTDILLHRLAVDLSQATHVHFTLRDEVTGGVIVDLPDAPFERDAGEILVACQRHFVVFPPDTVAEVTVHGPAPVTHRFTILHRWA